MTATVDPIHRTIGAAGHLHPPVTGLSTALCDSLVAEIFLCRACVWRSRVLVVNSFLVKRWKRFRGVKSSTMDFDRIVGS
ncbi:hypothetical protein OG874_23290 [Nocardia sp. NBC_00565]|uniref:hypothetical protein n=1 Tax=Nocardia sp. NBC_00565 TaxID=2975993 RepID=UPI002E80ACEF|nr:hypothetical protein [Nocardia sp. NBC_00565]WUB99849.1 hypothetical protein OG874_23290 [Nocardia sp. NBC_00565]